MPTKIEWCDETLNPFWGCTHGCSYCAARRIAHMRAERIGKQRRYPPEIIAKMRRFEPVWLPDADRILAQVEHWKKPMTIFVGFMGDMWCNALGSAGRIKVIQTAKDNPHHRFLFLTKNPGQYNRYGFPDNCWIGYSDDGTKNFIDWSYLGNADNCIVSGKNGFISFEPLIGHFLCFNPYLTKWIILGALTDRRGQPVPAKKGGTRLEWVMPIIEVADKHNIPVFLKNNLLKLYPQLSMRQEFPWK